VWAAQRRARQRVPRWSKLWYTPGNEVRHLKRTHLLLSMTSLAVLAAVGSAASLDVSAFRVLNGKIVNPIFDAIMPVVTDAWVLRILGAAVWIFLLARGGRRGRWAAIILVPLVAASDQLTSGLLKPLVGRPRPCEVVGNVHFWYHGTRWIWTPSVVAGGFKTSFGFPSSHAANVTAATLFLGLVYRRWVPYVGLSLAGLVSLSRIYTGVHWPSDVLAGIALGAGLAWLAYLGFKRALAWRVAKPSVG
jgi:undecaprenyl-diphosphatase